MNKPARYYAHAVLKKVLGEGAYLNMALKGVHSLSPQDMALVTRLTNATLSHLNQIDYVLNPLIGSKRVHSSVRLILRMATCEVMFLGTPHRAAVFEAVNLAKATGKGQLAGFVNAVLHRLIETKDAVVYPDETSDLTEYLNVFTGYPKWLIREVIEDYGENFAHQLFTFEPEHDQTHVRLNPLVDTQDEIFKRLAQQGLNVLPDDMFEDGADITHFSGIAQNSSYLNGDIAVMGKASMLCVKNSGVKPETKVLDACAAPGGKTAYLSALMQNTGEITAWDIHPHRIELTEKTLARLKCTNVKTAVKNAGEYDASLNETFDLVFLDLPCSSLGLAYKKPDVRLSKTKEDVLRLAALQKDIINACKNYVKPGGTLMITTCSITRDESDLKWFFKKNKDFIEQKLEMLKGVDYVKKTHGVQLFWHISGMDGFFICKAKKEIS